MHGSKFIRKGPMGQNLYEWVKIYTKGPMGQNLYEKPNGSKFIRKGPASVFHDYFTMYPSMTVICVKNFP